jgi:hypothetical protein
MHRPLRYLAAQPATLTSAAAYEGAVTKTSEQNRALNCPDGGVRFFSHNERVTSNPAPESTAALIAPAAHAAAPRTAEGVAR